MKTWSRGLVAALIIVFAACSFRDKKGPEAAALNANAHMGYKEVNANILTPKCLSCHTSKEKPALTSYDDVKANLDKIQDMVFVQKKMPPRGPLTSDELAYLKSWIDQGAPEQGAEPSPTPTEGTDLGSIQRPVKWEVVDKTVFEPKCFNCHYPHNPDGDTDYTDLPTLKDTMGSILFVSITKPQMPPAPDSLSEAQKDILAAWVIDGMDMPSPTPAPVVSPSPFIMPSPTPLPIPAGSPGPLSSPLPPSPMASPSPSPQ